MKTTNYIRGRKKEYELKHKLERQGFTVFRTAGSHGVADLIAIKEGIARFIQIKFTKKPISFNQEANELRELSSENIGLYFELYHYILNAGIHNHIIYYGGLEKDDVAF